MRRADESAVSIGIEATKALGQSISRTPKVPPRWLYQRNPWSLPAPAARRPGTILGDGHSEILDRPSEEPGCEPAE